MPVLRVLVVVAGVFASLASTCNNEPLPEPDLCDLGATSGASSLEFLTQEGDVPITDGDVVNLVVGGQGIGMLALRYRVRGTTAECLSVALRVVRCERMGSRCDGVGDSQVIYDLSRSLRAYAGEAGAVATDVDFAILSGSAQFGDKVVIDATVAGAQATRVVWIEAVAPQDGGPDAQVPDAALDASIDAAPDAAL